MPQIAAMLQMKRPTVQSWKQRDGWDSVAPISRVEMSLEARLTQLIIKPQKPAVTSRKLTCSDARLNDWHGSTVTVRPATRQTLIRTSLTATKAGVANRKEFFSDEAIEKLEQIFFEQSFEYQLHWYRAGLEHRIRDILKSRQIGATFYFPARRCCAP